MAEDSRSLDDYLATFYEGARLDSQGQFTLDLESRARKTAAFQLTQPELFVIPLMMAAWLGGARQFEVEPLPDGFALTFDGQICREAEIEQLQGCLDNRLPDPTDERLGHLAVAMRLARELRVDLIELQLPETHGLAWKGGRLQLEAPGALQRLSFRQRESPLARLFGSRLIKIRQAVGKIVSQRGFFGLEMQPGLAQLDIGPPSGLPALGRLLPEDPQLSGHLALLPWSSPSQAWFVHHGVLFPIPALRRSLRPPYRLLLQTPNASPDLGYANLIQNDQMQAWLRLIPAWLGELEWAYLLLNGLGEGSAAEVCWDVRQRTLHGLPAPQIDWERDSGVSQATQLGHGRTFAEAGRAYARLRFLPISWDTSVPAELDGGSPVIVKPTARDGILDRVYPRQQEFLSWGNRAVARQVWPGRMLLAEEYVHVGPLTEGVQVGLNLQPQRHSAVIWMYESVQDGRLHAWKAVEPGEATPQGITIAATQTPTRWDRALLETLRAAWLDHRTELDPERHSLLLEHWLLAAKLPKLRAQLELSSVWAWSLEGRQVFLSDLRHGQPHGLRLSKAVELLLPLIWT